MYVIIIMCYYFAWVDISRVIDFTIAICQNLIFVVILTGILIRSNLTELWHAIVLS